MKRIIVAFGVTLVGAALLQAQDIKSTTQVKADDAKPVVYTGCLQTAAETKAFILENAIPQKQTSSTTTTVGQGGAQQSTSTTTTTYSLIPGEKIEFQKNVGQKVEVTAVMIPAGKDTSKIETKTKTEVEGQPDRKVETKEKIPQGDMPQLRVVAIKQLSDRCQP
jgi:hypothetical protein